MRNHKLLKYGFLGLSAIILSALGLFLFIQVHYSPDSPFPHSKIAITLPFAPEREADNIIPMGETIAHPYYGGHSGIDFQWQEPAPPLIAVGDGKVSRIYNEGEDLILILSMGEYQAAYWELARVADGIREGSSVKRGDTIAYPMCEGGGCQLHWDFGYGGLAQLKTNKWPFDKKKVSRLCPLTHFDEDARRRINAIWDTPGVGGEFRKEFPHICSGVYYEHHR